MKLATAIVAIVLAIVPMAKGQPGCATPANGVTLTALTITNAVKRTTVNGGARVVQTVTVRNTAAAAANGLALRSALDPVLTLAKANTKPRTTVSAAGALVTSTAFTLAAGATLKATITYKSQRCPAVTAAHPVPIQVFVPADGIPATCFVAGPAATVTVTRKATC